MKFWKFSTQAVAAILASVSIVSASGPTDGEATADPNSAVVKLTTKEFKSFLDENPLVLTEFFAPWCGYCKQIAPEFTAAADSLNQTHPKIKLAQVDCTEEEELCQQHGIKGYPTLKVMRGPFVQPEDYDGPRDSEGIVSYMIQQSLPPVQQFSDVKEFVSATKAEKKPYMVQILPSGAKEGAAQNQTYGDVASANRQSMSFYSIENDAEIAKFDKLVNADLSGSEAKYLVIHPNELNDVREFTADFSSEALAEFSKEAKVPYFGDINRDTYMVYMASSLPLGYYFHNTPEERASANDFFTALGKKYKGKINFVGLDASQFGRHAEILNMNPEIVPLFAIQDNSNGRKYGIDQTAHPDGPSQEAIGAFVESFMAGEVEPIIKSEPLPTTEEIASQAVLKLVAHNYQAVMDDLSKDVFVKYYAPWCGHCKKLAPIWEEMAEIYDSKAANSKVVIANVDHTLNDVDTPIMIEGYPTLILYPANGEIDAKSGMRKAIVYDGGRDMESLIEFIKTKGALGVDGELLKAAKVAGDEDVDAEEEEEEENDHDEL